MFDWAKNFFRRHKRKIFITGAVAGGMYLAGRYLLGKLEEYQERETLLALERAKKQQHFESNQRTCFVTLVSFLPKLRDRILSSLSTAEIYKEIKLLGPAGNNEEKQRLWHRMKIVGISCTICSILSTCMLYMYLKLKVNIVGGYIYMQKEQQEDDFGPDNDNEEQKEYFKNVQHFMEVGLPSLIEHVQHLVQENCGHLSMQDELRYQELAKLTEATFKSFFVVGKDASMASKTSFSVLEYLIDKNLLDAQHSQSSEFIWQIWNETADAIESKDFIFCLHCCADACMRELLKRIQPHFEYEDPEAIVDADSALSPRRLGTLPVAKIISRISGQTHEIFKSGPNEYLDVLFGVSVAQDFGASVYECFSSSKDS